MRLHATLVVALLATACATSNPPPAALEVNATKTPGQAGAVRTRTASAQVKSVDAATRSITLVDAGGDTQTFTVGPEVKRFNEIKPGDAIEVEIEQGLLLEYQPPGSPTVRPQAAVGGGVASQRSAPGAAVVAAVQGTVVVVDIDRSDRIVWLQASSEEKYRVKAGPGIQLERLQIGDRLLATYLETVAVKVVKAGQTL
jgi:hypothetical protein